MTSSFLEIAEPPDGHVAGVGDASFALDDEFQALADEAAPDRGRIAAVVGLITAIICAKPLLGSFDQAFQYIQEFTGFFTPGICVIFLLGMFWDRTTSAGAAAVVTGRNSL